MVKVLMNNEANELDLDR